MLVILERGFRVLFLIVLKILEVVPEQEGGLSRTFAVGICQRLVQETDCLDIRDIARRGIFALCKIDFGQTQSRLCVNVILDIRRQDLVKEIFGDIELV